MRSRLLAWTATAVLLSLTGTGTAMADAGATQAVGQTAGSAQTADADASSTQVQPTNQNISVRVLSPGDSGAVSQSNESEAAAAAANANATGQAAQQSQPAGGTQAVGQAAHSSQSADADAASKQIKPTNQNVSVRVLSKGDDGPVEQENSSSAAALAANANKTAQDAKQSGGGDDDGGGTQAIGQKVDNEQSADADATSVQYRPENVNAPVHVLSDGDGGDVDQENSSKAKSAALNANATKQAAAQDQRGGEEASETTAPETASAPRREGAKQHKGGEDHGAPAIQAVGQKAANDQDAESEATSKQAGAKNVNAPVRVKSRGDERDVEQSNRSKAGSLAANKNATGQFAKQTQGERDGGGPTVQAIGQISKSEQDADSEATSVQAGAKNLNAPVGAVSHGGGGDIEQSNKSEAGSIAANKNATKQAAAQRQGGDDDSLAIQAIGQAAFNEQDADSEATSVQLWPTNVNAPVATLGGHGDCSGGKEDRKDKRSAERTNADGCHATGDDHEGGGEGSVEQDTTSAALSAGLNANWTGQFAVQG